MELRVRRSVDRGQANLDWLDSKHTFSFGHYYDPAHMGFGPLRVINEDNVVGGGGFSPHPHANMEILSYVLGGALEHKDSIGTGSVIRPGDVQRMSAGTGIRHSEFNASPVDPVHFLQIWIVPGKLGIQPSYEQKSFADSEKRGRLCLVGSRDGRGDSVTIHQDVDLFVSMLEPGEKVSHGFHQGRLGWVQVARGAVEINGEVLEQGDGAALSQGGTITIQGKQPAEILLFDMAPFKAP
jgi:redox-sensitive bicupin YhaK (pirin superfamily)